MIDVAHAPELRRWAGRRFHIPRSCQHAVVRVDVMNPVMVRSIMSSSPPMAPFGFRLACRRLLMSGQPMASSTNGGDRHKTTRPGRRISRGADGECAKC